MITFDTVRHLQFLAEFLDELRAQGDSDRAASTAIPRAVTTRSTSVPPHTTYDADNEERVLDGDMTSDPAGEQSSALTNVNSATRDSLSLLGLEQIYVPGKWVGHDGDGVGWTVTVLSLTITCGSMTDGSWHHHRCDTGILVKLMQPFKLKGCGPFRPSND